MAKFLVFLFFVVCFIHIEAAVLPSSSDVEDFESFLRNTVNGIPKAPATEELAELQNTEERSGKFEGDILLTEDQIQEMVKEYATKNALTATNKLWPSKTVYYSISTAFTSAQRNAIINGINELARQSCVQFRERTNQAAYIQVTNNNDGCYATVGYTGGRQTLNLAPNNPGSGCFRHGTIMHEFLHSIGFYHMQSTYDRDDWVRIVWNKIQAGAEHNFNKYTSSQVTNLGQTYDYGSVMHYSEYGFSIDGSKTIVPLKTHSETIGQRTSLSAKDIARLRRLYNC